MSSETGDTAVVVDGEDSVDAGEDGDFVVLRENRQARVPETLEGSLAETDFLVHSVVSRPSSSRLRKLTVAGGEGCVRWAEIADSVRNEANTFKDVLEKITSEVFLSSSQLQAPHNKPNILHFVLERGDRKLISTVLELADEQLITHKFDVEVMKNGGKKTALHQVVDKNDLNLLKLLLGKISRRDKRISLLNVETSIEIKGQRPRTFPCLHLAAYHGYTDIVEYILEEGVDVDHLNAKKDTALLWAVRWGHIDTVRVLLSHGARPDLENDKGSTALYWAVRYGHVKTVEVLAVEGKADVNKQRKLGLVAPIVLASTLGLSQMVSVLLKYGANPNTAIRGHERPLHHAAKEGFSDIIELLISHGAEVDAADVRGDNALLLAAKYGNAKALYTLLTHGAHLEHRNILGENVWKFAVTNEADLILKLLVVHQTTLQTDQEADELTPSTAGVHSLLFLTAAAGNISRMSVLFNMEVNANATDDNGNTFLHIAAANNQPKVIAEFHKKVNIDSTNVTGNTALHEACSRGHHEVIATLINIKAMANIRNRQGETALHVAAYCRSIEPRTISLLMEFIIKTHSWECLSMSDNCHNSALHIAARTAGPDVLWEFRSVGLKEQDTDGDTALHKSVRPGEPEVLDMMLDIFDDRKRDCDINHKNNKGETPLFLAARAGLLCGVKRLILFGGDISIPSSDGNSVLHMLTSQTVSSPDQHDHFLKVIRTVLDGAPLWYITQQKLRASDGEEEYDYTRRRAVLKLATEILNNDGLSVLDLACKLGASDVVKLLVSMENVMAFKVGNSTRYDVSKIMPRTNGSLDGSLFATKVVPRSSCLEWLLASGRVVPQNAAKVLDIQPFRDIEAAYGAVANWSYAFMMLMHITYMSVFSWSGVTVLNDSRTGFLESSVNYSSQVTYIIVPLEPLGIFGYAVYGLVKLCCVGDMPLRRKLARVQYTMKLSLTILASLIYSIFVVSWVIMHATQYQYRDIFLAIALCLGWMLTIGLTRGFKIINYFWRLIEMVIVRDVFKFLVVYLFILLAFSFAFHALFQVSQTIVSQYPNPAHTMFLMFNMLIGMEYVFDEDLVSNGLRAENRSDVYIKVFYIFYMILATIVLLNILIAMMNDSYREILERQQVTWRIESVALGFYVEQSAPASFTFFSKVQVKHGYICSSDERYGIMRWYIDVPNPPLSSNNGSQNGIDGISELKSKMVTMDTSMMEQFNSIKCSVDEIQSRLKSLEQTLTARSQ